MKAEPYLTAERLTAPHYLAYSWVMSRVRQERRQLKIMDVGSRYSVLPSLMAMEGHMVVACDRDERVVEWQRKLAAEHGVDLDVMGWLPEVIAEDLRFDAITVCWAIQHNEPQEQAKIAEKLAGWLAPGGQLLFVSSFTFGQTTHQTNREDPQWVLNYDDHVRYVIGPSRLLLGHMNYFTYEHATTSGGWCSPKEANACAYQLVDPRRKA